MLLDGVLAAVDNHVARHRFGECERILYLFSSQIMGRARVVVTNGTACLSQINRPHLMCGGIVLASETYPHAISNNHSELSKFM
jgi:hypothetical protein